MYSTTLNKAIVREQFSYVFLIDIFHKPSQAKVFIRGNFCKGYWYIQLHEISSVITTFNTPFRGFGFTKIWHVGLRAAGDAFQQKLDSIYNRLEFIIGIINDMIIRDEHEYG